VSSLRGRLVESCRDASGADRLVQLLGYVPGRPLAEVRPHSPALLQGAGRLLGRVAGALAGYRHAAAERVLQWDLQRGRDVVERHLSAVTDAERRRLVEHFMALFERTGVPLLDHLRTGVIHGDGNDWNILVGTSADPLEPAAVTGLVDFGDIVHSWIAAEPAIAAAYAMLDKIDPVAAAAHVLRGFHAEFPLTPVEIEAVYPLACLRLCSSVVLSAHQRRQRPDNAYLGISERGAWALLERLHGVHPRFAHYVLRDACGLPACPRSAAVTRRIGAHAAEVGPVVEPDPRTAPCVVFDLGPGSPEWSTLHGRGDAAAWWEAILGRLRATGSAYGLGRYDEVRRWYTGDAFRTATDDGPEWRTVHLGIDVFAAPGTPVLAPLDARVHSVRDNAGAADYGPTVVLEHELDGVVFHTLYGHLDGDAMRLEAGQQVARGHVIGRIGAPPGNGDWAPHVHVQIITDMLDRAGSFPGVARPGERAVWTSISPDPNLLLRIPALLPVTRWEATGERMDAGRIMAGREQRIGRNLSVSYRRPLHIVRGWMQYLYDAGGQTYLDCVNNVAHVGHCHPRVVAALSRQSSVLNTNTRYLHEKLVRYADRLTARLPEPLSVCFFVCSGSEANELALRLARAHTGRRDIIVLDGAYHGNTGTLIGLSPYKFDGPGGSGPGPDTHVAPLPDPYRGVYRGATLETGRAYAEHVRDVAARLAGPDPSGGADGSGVAAFLSESLPGCGGQIVLPPGFLAEAYRHVRAAGGVCIADEVQVGFGRVGTHFWGFETYGVVPDIVTLGKPIGNGHPLAAVVTTPAVAASFANGMEYFNTFGGNPVSCAVGLAVLDVLEEERLQERAARVGARLLAGLRQLLPRHPLVGDVRGLGLHIGVELVIDSDTLAPAPRHAAYVVERMRERGVLLGTDGPLRNVIKIKPPLQFSEADADRLCEVLDQVLGETPLRPPW
jgi:4-aminobutyrate aminotransferase-like enzyme/Ser/Thr protein kinase RdoA (MazF antagonist)